VKFFRKIAESLLEIRSQIIIRSIVYDRADTEDIAVSLQGLLEKSPSKSPGNLCGDKPVGDLFRHVR